MTGLQPALLLGAQTKGLWPPGLLRGALTEGRPSAIFCALAFLYPDTFDHSPFSCKLLTSGSIHIPLISLAVA